MIFFLGLLVSLLFSVSAFGAGFKDAGIIEHRWTRNSFLEGPMSRAGDGFVVSATTSKFLFPSPNTFEAIRFGLDGTRDMAFGKGGQISIPMKGQSILLRTRPTLSGKLVFLGVTRAGMTEDFDILLYRASASGAIDPTFGQGGAVRIDFDFGTEDQPVDVISLPGDEMLLVCQSTDQTVLRSLVMKLNADGSLDPFFGKNGSIDMPLPRGSALSFVFPGPPGTLVVFAGTPDGKLFSSRFFLDGSPDLTYGKGGLVELHFLPQGTSRFTQVTRVSEGGYAVLGENALNGKDSAFLARLDDSGELISTFGKSGVVAAADEKDKLNSLKMMQPVSGGGFLGLGVDPKDSALTFLKFGPDGALDGAFGNGGLTERKITKAVSLPFTLLPDGADWIFEVTLNSPEAGVLLGRLDAKGNLLGVKREVLND